MFQKNYSPDKGKKYLSIFTIEISKGMLINGEMNNSYAKITLQKNDKNYLRKLSCFRRLSNQ